MLQDLGLDIPATGREDAPTFLDEIHMRYGNFEVLILRIARPPALKLSQERKREEGDREEERRREQGGISLIHAHVRLRATLASCHQLDQKKKRSRHTVVTSAARLDPYLTYHQLFTTLHAPCVRCALLGGHGHRM